MSRSTLHGASVQSLTLAKRRSSWVTSWSKSRSWPGDFAIQGPCLSSASRPNDKKPFCWDNATPSSSGAACHAWSSTTTSKQPCCKCSKGIADASTTCFCTSTVSIAGIALFANVHAGWEKGSVENLVGYARRNYLVPLPEGTDLEAI